MQHSDKTKLDNVSEHCGAIESSCKLDIVSPVQTLEPPEHQSAEIRSLEGHSSSELSVPQSQHISTISHNQVGDGYRSG